MKTNKATIVFFGTPEFAVPSLKALIDNGYHVVAVVTNPDKPIGRKQVITPSPVKELAKKHGIPVLQPEKLDANYKLQTINYKPDIFIIASYGKIIPKDVLAIPKHGTLNVHPSLLPKYRGPSPIQAAILKGEEKTGVTIMLTDEKMDHGPILAQKALENVRFSAEGGKVQSSKFNELYEALAKLGAELLVETLPKWLAGEITPEEQDHAKATYTKILKKEDGKIDWEHSAEEIERKIRAFEVWPGSWSMARIRGKNTRIKVIEAKIDGDRDFAVKPGSLIKKKGDLLVASRNKFLVIEKLQLEGRKTITGSEFLKGYPDISFFLPALS